MAISNYGELKASIADWLNREDLVSVIPDFVRLAEGRMNSDSRIRSRFTVTSQLFPGWYNADPISPITLPSDFKQIMSVTVNGRALTRLPEAEFLARDAANGAQTDQARYYMVFKGQLFVTPWPTEAGSDWTDVSMEVRYYSNLDLTSGQDSDTNLLLEDCPNAYLYASLAQAGIYLQNQAVQQTYETYYQEALNNFEREYRRAAATDVQSVTSIGPNSF